MCKFFEMYLHYLGVWFLVLGFIAAVIICGEAIERKMNPLDMMIQDIEEIQETLI